MAGKLPPEILVKYVFPRIGVKDPSVIVGPEIGEDAALIDLGDGRILIVHVDPITGAIENIGWLAVHIACNDIAVRGAKPRWLLPVLYLPENTSIKDIDRITNQLDKAAKEVGAMIVGGHSEYTAGIDRPMVSMTAIGIAYKELVVRTGGARPGDLVLMTKKAGLEGTSILATDFEKELMEKGVGREVIKRAKHFINYISVVKEALLLAENRLASSMHDPTEGGVLGGLLEIAYASKVSINIWRNKIPVAEETKEICSKMNIDPLKLISSGVLIATVNPRRVRDAVELLESEGIEATIIGRVVHKRDYLVAVHEDTRIIEKYSEPYVEDELFRLWSKMYKETQ